MTAFLYSLIGFVVAIGLLTAIHEYGHFWVARRLGVKVLRFSIGFGKKIYSWHDKSGTEYAICAIPLGGYVKMLDQNEGIVAPSELHRAFNNKPVWIRMLIIAAGPICNMLFAVLAYWLIFVWGVAGVVPILGDVPPSSVAYAAGLRSGQEITAVDNRATTSWEDIVLELMRHSDEHDYIPITTLDTTSKTSATHRLNLQNWSIDNNANDFLSELGLVPLDPLLPIVGSTVAYYPAQQAGLQAGDLIKAINGEPVNSISQLLHTLHDKYGQELNVQISRNGKDLTTQIMPVKKVHENGDVSGFIGVQFAPQKWPDKYIRIHRYSPLVALDMALDRTKEYSILTLQFLGKMAIGKMSLDHISGPIAIAQYAGITVRSGMESFLGFLALVSISLGVLNMLPIPVLDGGHFLFCAIELIRGKALSQRAMNAGVIFGFVVLGSVMLLALVNDVTRLLR